VVSWPLSGLISVATSSIGDEPLFIGSDGSGADNRFLHGVLDEVKIYRRALTSEQVQQLYMDSKDGMSRSSTVVSAETETGEVWKCVVTPNDRYQDGMPAESNELPI